MNIMFSVKKTFCFLAGTSNWTEDYFTTTAGVTIVLEPYKKTALSTTDIRQQMEEIFFRDFNSTLAQKFKVQNTYV